MKPGRLYVIALALVAAPAARGQAPSWAAADHPAIERVGLWRFTNGVAVTPYLGSRLRFGLTGPATIRLTSPEVGAVAVRIDLGTNTVFSGVWTAASFRLDPGGVSGICEVAYTASAREGFYHDEAMLQFAGLHVEPGSVLYPPPERAVWRVDFLGDSITAGDVILGRDGAWHEHSDATLSFAGQTGELLGAAYAVRGFPGARLQKLIEVYPWFSRDVPLEPNHQPDWIIINAGANDRQLDARGYRRHLRKLVELVRTTHPGTRVVLLNFFRMTPSRFPAMQEVMRNFPEGDVLCFDARPFLVDYTDQHVHPGPESHRRLAEALANYLRQADVTK